MTQNDYSKDKFYGVIYEVKKNHHSYHAINKENITCYYHSKKKSNMEIGDKVIWYRYKEDNGRKGECDSISHVNNMFKAGIVLLSLSMIYCLVMCYSLCSEKCVQSNSIVKNEISDEENTINTKKNKDYEISQVNYSNNKHSNINYSNINYSNNNYSNINRSNINRSNINYLDSYSNNNNSNNGYSNSNNSNNNNSNNNYSNYNYSNNDDYGGSYGNDSYERAVDYAIQSSITSQI